MQATSTMSRGETLPPHIRAYLREYKKRAAAKQGLLGALFPQQRKAVKDKSKKKVYETTRRAGKTYGFISECIDCGLKEPGSKFTYIALTRPSAEDIAWPILKEIDQRHGLHMRFQEAKLQAVLPNGSSIKLYGVDRPGLTSRLYGQKLRKVGIDEAAFFAINVRDLVEDVLDSCVADLEGEIILMSIPGYVKRGYFWDVVSGKVPGWSLHKWTALDNPFMRKQFKKKLDELIKNDPSVVDTPSFRRNYLGEWVHETRDLVYAFSEDVNCLDAYNRTSADQYVLGVDLGWHDASAFSLCAYSKSHPNFVELESVKKPHILLDEVAAHIQAYIEAFPGVVVVADPARRQLIEELQLRFGLPIYPADKTDKNDWIDLVNTDYANGVIKLLNAQSSPHAEEMEDLKWKIYPNGKRVEQPGQPNDACDAFLYAYRHSWHHRYEKPEARPEQGTRAHWKAVEQEIERRLVDEYEAMESLQWWEK